MSLKNFLVSIPVDQKTYDIMCSCGLDDIIEWVRVGLRVGAVEFRVVDSAAYRDYLYRMAADPSISKRGRNAATSLLQLLQAGDKNE